MTFCSIEEAWGSNFNTENKDINLFPNLETNIDEVDYQNINLPNRYKQHPSILVNNSNSKKTKKPLRNPFKRTMTRLSNHLGPNSRYINKNNTHKLSYINNINSNKSPKKEVVIDSNPTYHNLDTPISEYNYKMENTILKDQINKDIYNIDEIVQEEEYYPNQSEYDTDIVNIRDENSEEDETDLDNVSINNNKKNIDNSINKIVNSSKNNELNNIIIYIITGIFIIFILDIFTKLGKNSK